MKKMTKKANIIASLVLFIGIACSAATHWDYSMTNWHWLSPDWATCGSGTAQSPININTTGLPVSALGANSLTFNYTPANGTAAIKNNGHTIEVEYPAGSNVTINGTTYELKQFHFHNLSEHTVNNSHYAMEMHLVHADANGNLAVVGVFLDDSDAGLKSIVNSLDGLGWSSLSNYSETPQTLSGTVDVYSFMPNLAGSQTSYYSYSGSLTTPPCTEAVSWNVLTTPVYITSVQAHEFFAVTHHHTTNRPVQALNGRTVTLNQ